MYYYLTFERLIKLCCGVFESYIMKLINHIFSNESNEKLDAVMQIQRRKYTVHK